MCCCISLNIYQKGTSNSYTSLPNLHYAPHLHFYNNTSFMTEGPLPFIWRSSVVLYYKPVYWPNILHILAQAEIRYEVWGSSSCRSPVCAFSNISITSLASRMNWMNKQTKLLYTGITAHSNHFRFSSLLWSLSHNDKGRDKHHKREGREQNRTK